ncbi:hypothetical protein [Micromonospora marina]|uniref:hypothetical protein n=1 Tax=Micromonospora marina TaxID=307120 RepID=UPI0034563E87
MKPNPGDILLVTRAASVQFAKPIRFRVIRALDWTTYDGWAWLDGYELDARGEAVARRTIFVQPAGLRRPPHVRASRARAPPAHTGTQPRRPTCGNGVDTRR